MSRPLLFFSLTLLPLLASSQSDRFRYDKDLLTADFHSGRREALRALMADNSMAIFYAHRELIRSNDVEYQFSQDPNFYYLTGCPEPEAILVIFKNKVHIDSLYTNEIIFVRKRDPFRETWTGRRLGTEGVKKVLGFKDALLNTQFESFYPLLKNFGRDSIGEKNDLQALREIKTPEEMTLLRKAILITCESHAVLMQTIDTAMTEYQAQAVVEYGFKVRGSEYPGYPSIVGSGENTCILHYTENRRKFTKTDLLVVDAGAEYHGYTADITRTLPVQGTFSKEQKIIYDIVYEAQEAGISACHTGNEFRAPHNVAYKVVAKRLKEQGIIKEESEARKYFFHGTSHYLGLDVHDAGLYGKLKPGNVITVEPGIYIPEGSDCDPKWWNTGVRIEDDILITNGDPENLSASLPRKAEEVEALMKKKILFPGLPKEK